jgi:Ca2+-dependent lipid-binding protein
MRLALKGRGVLRIRLLRGEGLKAMDDTTKDGAKDASDPYCELALGEEEEKSETIRESLNPEWDELFEFRGKKAAPANAQKGQPTMAGQRPTLRDLISTPLKLELFDENRMMGLNMLARNKTIGKATVDLSPLLSSHEVPLRVPLSTQGFLSIVASWEVEEKYNPLEDELRGNGVLRVHLHSSSSLKPADDTTGDGKADNADPYCKLSIADWKQQTATLDQTLDPTWDERFEFRGFDQIYGGRWSLSDLLSTPLELAICDEDRNNLFFGTNNELGTASVDVSPLRVAREMTVTVPLNTQGDVTLTLSWEVEEPYVEGDAEAFALEAKDVVLRDVVETIRERLHALGFDADKERVAAMVIGRDYVQRRFGMEEI